MLSMRRSMTVRPKFTSQVRNRPITTHHIKLKQCCKETQLWKQVHMKWHDMTTVQTYWHLWTLPSALLLTRISHALSTLGTTICLLSSQQRSWVLSFLNRKTFRTNACYRWTSSRNKSSYSPCCTAYRLETNRGKSQFLHIIHSMPQRYSISLLGESILGSLDHRKYGEDVQWHWLGTTPWGPRPRSRLVCRCLRIRKERWTSRSLEDWRQAPAHSSFGEWLPEGHMT